MNKLLLGIISSLIGNCLIGASFTLKRWISVRPVRGENNTSAFARIRNWRWWLAVNALLIGELLNFAAYVTAPSFLVVMLGCVNVLAAQLTSAVFLKEYFTSVRLLGTFVISLGVTLCIVSTPPNERAASIDRFPQAVRRLAEPAVQVLFSAALSSIVLLGVIAFRLERYKNRSGQTSSEPVRTSISVVGLSMYGFGAMLTVTVTKAIGILMNQAVFERCFYWHYAPYYFVWAVAVTLWGNQLWLINWLLAHLEASAVTPLMYIVYTLCGAFASGVYYREFADYDSLQVVLLLVAVVMMCIGCHAVTMQYPRERGFWPLCCPRFELSLKKPYSLLGIEEAREKWQQQHPSALLHESKSSNNLNDESVLVANACGQ